jgi:hypothetical protein
VATKKQRRRREKGKRHEYEVVEIDAEGNETVLRASDLKVATPPGRVKAQAKTGTEKPRGGLFGGGKVQEPSWRRVIKRGLLFAPLFLATVLLLGRGKITLAGGIVQTALLMAVFVPFSYFMDRLLWRSYQKRAARPGGGR